MAEKIRFKSVEEALNILIASGYGIKDFYKNRNEFTAVKKGSKDISCRFDDTQTIYYANDACW